LELKRGEEERKEEEGREEETAFFQNDNGVRILHSILFRPTLRIDK